MHSGRRRWVHSLQELTGLLESTLRLWGVLEVFPMKTVVGLFLFALCSSLTTTGQILPNSSCGCDVLSSGVVGCNCASGGNINKESVPSDRSQIFETRVRLSPGALLTRWVEGDDELIIGIGNGEIANEVKSPPVNVFVREGSIFFMPKVEPYRLRNVGKQDVEVR